MTRLVVRVGLTRPARFISRHLGWKLDPVLLRLTKGRVATTLVIPTAVLETQGSRTGVTRRNAVIYFHDADRAIIAASNAGAPEHPAWYRNLLANPDVAFGGIPMRAQVVEDPSQQARLWPLADCVFPGFQTYRREAAEAGRQIPLIALEPPR